MHSTDDPISQNNLRLRESIYPNLFAQVFSHERIGEIETSNNEEMIKQHAGWLHEFGNLKLAEKLQILQKMDDL